MILALLVLVPTVSQAESTMYDRVCPRVVNRFQNDMKMWDRVNERIWNRFGFSCEKTPSKSSSSSSSYAPIPYSSSSISSSSSSSVSGFELRAEYWNKFHEELLDAAKELTRQGSGAKDCIRVLANLETIFIARYNNDFLSNGDETGLRQVEKDFKAAPKICF